MNALSNTMISALWSSKTSGEGIMACTTRTGKALEVRGLASRYYRLATDTIPQYQISAAGREHLARIDATKSALAAGVAPIASVASIRTQREIEERHAELRADGLPTPAQTLDIPAAVRRYIEAEWRGASVAALSAMRGEITAALLASDPELSNTAATVRFHKLVAEMRDNDSIGADLLAQMTRQSDRQGVQR